MYIHMRHNENVLEINRISSEYLRGLAIVFVVLGHILGGTFGVIDEHTTSLLGIGGVNIFLLLSGYGLYCSYRKNGVQGKKYWDKKIEKVFIPYAVITVVYYLYMMLLGVAPGGGRFVAQYTLYRLFQNNGWYHVVYEFFTVMVFCVFLCVLF